MKYGEHHVDGHIKLMNNIPRLFVHEELGDDGESIGWVLSSGNHLRDVEVVLKTSSEPDERLTIIHSLN